MAATGGRPPETIATTLAAIISGATSARTHADETVVYEQRGVFAWDTAFWHSVYQWAIAHHAGTAVHFSEITDATNAPKAGSSV